MGQKTYGGPAAESKTAGAESNTKDFHENRDRSHLASK